MLEFNHEFFESFRADVIDALKDIATKYNVDIKTGGIKYGDISFTMNLNVTEKVNGAEDAGEASWSYYCRAYGFSREDYGKTFKDKGITYTICGIDDSARKYPILAKSHKNNKIFGFTSQIIHQYLEELKNE